MRMRRWVWWWIAGVTCQIPEESCDLGQVQSSTAISVKFIEEGSEYNLR